jgi:5,10-methylenetetrahydromethanopterin reductase
MGAMTPVAAPRLGVVFLPSLPPERLRAVALATEASGLDELWLWEDCFKESGIAMATAALAWTERVHVGIGLMPAPLRNVALQAMEIATVDRLFPGRFIPGVGHGVQDWMGQVGGRAESPMTLMTEYVDAVQRLLAGERVSTQGRYVRLNDVKLDWPPEVAPALMLGGEGPRTLSLAGRVGDGTLLTGAQTDEQIEWACGVIAAANEKALADEGASGPADRRPHQVFALQIATTGPDAERRLDDELVRWDKAKGVGIGVAGDAEAIVASVRRLAGYGVTSVTIQPTQDEPDLEGFIHFLGHEVRPLLQAGS